MPVQSRELRSFVLQDDPLNANGIRGKLVKMIDNSSFSIEYIHEPERSTSSRFTQVDEFGLFLKPNDMARRLYGLDREILLWCSTHKSFQARDIDKLSALSDAHGARLSRQFAVLVTQYASNTRNPLESEADRDQSLVHVSFEEIIRDGLDNLLSRHLYSRDLFDVTGATLRSADFFGRRELIDRISSEIEAGTSQIGVFGLRKVGKTSLLNRIADKLQNSGKVIVARLDLQWTTAINERPEYTLWAMGESIYASHRSIKAVKNLRLFGQYGTFSDLQNVESVWELFAHDLAEVATQQKRGICVLVDEIERMYESPARRGFIRFWRLLRGIDQERPGRLRIIVGGTSPQCAELGQVNGEDNPLFNYLQLEYLGPLTRDDSSSLLNTLGGTMGLSFDDGAIEWALSQCGGHPALLRALGSVAHRGTLGRRAPVRFEVERLAGFEADLRQRVSPVIDQMLASLRDQYPTEFELLEELAAGKIFVYREYAQMFPAEVRRLSNYGLIAEGEPPAIAIIQLHSRLLSAQRSSVAFRVSRSETVSLGSQLGGWKVEEAIASGGYATVYRVTKGTQVAAAKAIRCGQLSQLQREMDVLTRLSHPGIVRFIDSLLSDDGTPCLIMEYLPGRTAASYCTPSARPRTEVLTSWSRQLLEALASMHPRAELARQLQSSEAMDSATFSAWNRAKHGYVHRDVKPENIMIVPDRGPVLIDFNISVRSGAPVLTTSLSAGYVAGLPVAWSPSTDLYGLGVTLLELGAGQRLSNCSLEELEAIASAAHGAHFRDLAKQLIAADANDGSASELLALPLFRNG